MTTKTIYLLDPDTGDLVGESVHPLDPVETERRGEPVYALLNSAFATEVAPPTVPKGKKVRMVNGKWKFEQLPQPPEPEAPVEPPKPPEPVPPTFDERLVSLQSFVQEYMDAMARSLGYDDIRTAVTYAEEPAVPKFQNEGRALRAWRSNVWLACHELLAQVKSGEVEEPAKESLPGLLPRLVVPALEETVQAAPAAGASE